MKGDKFMPNISIIIPCYNVEERYIKRCINRILHQSYKDFEIIIIDDGSQKQYARVLDDIALTDSRINVHHQNNGGVSDARNKGISLAKGEYIAFVDADDTISKHYMEEAICIIEKEKADILYGYTYRGTQELSDINEQKKQRPDYEEVSNEWLRERLFRTFQPVGNKSFGRGPYARLLRKELAREVLFPKGIPIGEDVIWNLEILKHAKKKILVNSIWYNYIICEDSVTRKYSPDIEERLKPFYQAIEKYLDDTPKDKALYVSRIAYDFTNYILNLYIGSKQNQDSYLGKWKKTIIYGKKEPWFQLKRANKQIEIYAQLDKPTKTKSMLMRFGLLWPIWNMQHNKKRK